MYITLCSIISGNIADVVQVTSNLVHVDYNVAALQDTVEADVGSNASGRDCRLKIHVTPTRSSDCC